MLRKIGLSTLIVFLAVGCVDNQRDRRAAFKRTTDNSASAYPNNQPTGGSIILPGGTNNEDKNNNNNNNNNSGSNNEITIPEELKHCQWSPDGVNGFASNNTHLGPHTICQNKNSETDIHIQVKNPITDAQLCIFPTYHSGSASIYIGEARCFMASNPKTIYKITVLKNRAGYSNFKVTGVMVMKDKAYFYPPPFYQYVLSPDAYLYCSKFLDQFQDPSYCNAFRSVAQYVYKQF